MKTVRKHPDLLWRLLRRNISLRQLGGYALANLVGLAVVMTALQFLRDVNAPAEGDGAEQFINRDFLILSKEVSETGAFFGNSPVFSPEEIAELRAQPWAVEVGEFTQARFQVSATVSFAGRHMSTYLFFEAIPDRFFDRLPSGWTFDPADRQAVVPIVISRDYLALYNFGFASTRSMPKISESTIERIPLGISVSGNGRQRWLEGRIAGFSSRLNTIAVPESFMRWANAEFGDPDQPAEVSRLIAEVRDPGSPAMTEWLRSHGIEIAGDKANQSKTAYFLSVLSTVVVAIGALICALSFFILMLSINLLLQKNAAMISRLLFLGYPVAKVSRTYIRLVAVLNGAIWVVASAAVIVACSLWGEPLESLGLGNAPAGVTVAAGALIMILLTAVNAWGITRKVRRNFRNEA